MNSMTEKDLDIAIEKCERIMEFDTRTLKNPESENGYIFEKVYDLLQFLRQFQFSTDAKVDNDMNSRSKKMPDINIIIDTIKNAINASTGNKDYMVGLRNGMRWCLSVLTDKEPEYESIPPAESRWIPCTPETMPQEDGEYLVTIHWKNGGYYTDLLRYRAYLNEWKYEDEIFGTVVAWQPKPAPYQEEGQDG